MIYNIIFAFRFLQVNLDIYPDLGGLSNLPCLLVATLGTLLPQLSTWIIVCICLERMLSIRFPLQIRTQGSRKRAKAAFVLLLLILTGLNIPPAMHCFNNVYIDFQDMETFHEIAHIYVLHLLPLLIIIISNIITLITLYNRKLSAGNVSSRRNIATKFTRLSLVSGFLHCVSVIPSTWFYLYTNRIFNLTAKSYYILSIFTYCTFYLNNSLNFVLYSFTSKQFREDLKEQLKCFWF